MIAGVHGDANQGPFCAKAIANYNTSGSCPEVSTFDIIDTAAYAGVWYGLGSTAQVKLLSEAGLDCLQANYTLQVSNTTTSLAVVNSGRRSLGPVATLSVTSISTRAKDVCMSARDVCAYLGPLSGMMQSVHELRRIASVVRKQLPDQATILDDVAQKIEGYGSSISHEFTMVAEHVQTIQKLDGYLSAGNNTATGNVEQIKLEIIEICKHVDTLATFVDEMATARSLLGQAVVKLLIAGEFVSTVDVTEASALIGAAEQNILLRADRMKASLRAMSTAAQVLVADASVPYRNISWSLPGVATQNVTNKGRLEFSILGVTAPYNIIAVEGLPSKGYDAVLVYSCTENHVLETIQQAFFVLSRRPTLLPATLSRFLGVAASLGRDLDCENPFLTSGCVCAPFVESCSHRTP